ncbi:EAL domain-containing protein [Salibacterium qingdaonense]|uniref:EAL domain, c-di-GMP-specific phosphodiesterase class I (Or its enzymatically inactive variant) n=1 Tax=Salibacterium qingdaonense TaxID=266892 RepID=A0A1I4NFA2_9BACI|nr:EAL domain-containing protein [Salibacterium qingdaonense]SFM13980.1 EAL domain, c-di-GMP-specific phosphodiesterase class I (or its enzymatically inactive variant) [Salibacterium qingdaonense]
MKNGCDICMPQHKGYTITFKNKQNMEPLLPYFSTFDNNGWMKIDNSTFWAEESIVFDILDYLEAHFDTSNILAASAEKTNQAVHESNMLPVSALHQKKEASWIDTIIDEDRILSYFQPIVRKNGEDLEVIGHEILARGMAEDGSIISPFHMLEAARTRNRLFSLDRAFRLKAVENAAVVKGKMIFINFIPTAIYVPEHCLSSTIERINKLGIHPGNVVFEVVESDEVQELSHLKNILNHYRDSGFQYALDDVGTGVNHIEKTDYLQPDIVKLAREHVDGITGDPGKQKAARSLLETAAGTGAKTLAEGVERKEDMDMLSDMGYELFQGYYFAKPQKEPVQAVREAGDDCM